MRTCSMLIFRGVPFEAPSTTVGLHPGRWNMEPTNHPFRKQNDLPNLHEDMFHVNLPGCTPPKPPNLRKYEPILTRSGGKPWYGCAAAHRGVSMFGRPKDLKRDDEKHGWWIVTSKGIPPQIPFFNVRSWSRNYSLGGDLKCFFLNPIPGEMIQFDEQIFQMGWSHQVVFLLKSNLIVGMHQDCIFFLVVGEIIQIYSSWN